MENGLFMKLMREAVMHIYNEFNNENDAFDEFYNMIKAQIKIENFGGNQ